MESVSSYVNSLFNSLSYRIDGVLLDPGDIWIGFKDTQIVILTHAHFDHIYGLNRVAEVNPGVIVYTNAHGKEMLLNPRKNLSFYHGNSFVFNYPDQIITIENNEIVNLGFGLTAQAVFTPGHNPSCITWVTEHEIFTGDSYIPGIKTVTNLPGGDKTLAQASVELIKKTIGARTVHPGHKISK